MKFPNLERPDVYRGGGGILGKIGGGLMSVFDPLGLLGGLEQKMPEAPKGPESIATGQTVKEKAGGAFEEDAEAKSKARATARKGASKFRIPLADTKTGTASSGGSGIKI